MLIAKPAPIAKIREIAKKIAIQNPKISVDSFLLPRDVSCNKQWNMISVYANHAVILKWYLKSVQDQTINQIGKKEHQRNILEALLKGITENSEYYVIIDNKKFPLSVEYVLRDDSWISNAASIALFQAVAENLGDRYSDINVVTGLDNPWFEPSLTALDKNTKGVGIVQKIASLLGGPRQVYQNIVSISPYFNRTKLYELVDDFQISPRRRRVIYQVFWTNYFFVTPEIVGWNHALFANMPLIFSRHPVLTRIPGFRLNPADVRIDFPDGDFSGPWEITVDYDITPIDSIRSYFNVGELQATVATLSAEVLELQRDRKGLSEEAERLAGQLVEEEKARRIYQVRAAQADAVARFLHQTSNLVLQPLASTMIVFEDFIEIIEDCMTEWAIDKSEEELYLEFNESLMRIQHVYPTAIRVINGYRELFHAFYEIYVSTKPERDVNQDLRFIETLVKNKYILTQVNIELELDPQVPKLKMEGGVQSIFLELMHIAARHGAKNILVKSEYEEDLEQVHLSFYNDGEPIPEEKWEMALEHEVTHEGRGFGMVDARYIIEILNDGWLRLTPSDRNRFSVLFVIELLTNRHIVQVHSK